MPLAARAATPTALAALRLANDVKIAPAMTSPIVRMTVISLVTNRADIIAVVAEDEEVVDVDAEGGKAVKEDADADAEDEDAVGEHVPVAEVVAEIDGVDKHAVVCAGSVCVR